MDAVHRISIPEVPSAVYTAVVRAPTAPGFLELVTSRSRSTVETIVQRDSEFEGADQRLGGFNLTARRSERAVNRFLRRDVHALNELIEGKLVRCLVPLSPSRDRRVGLSNTLEQYRRLRISAGESARPLLLATPSIDHLMPFQREGVGWLLETRKAILADDMGLGKTVQAITGLRLLVNSGAIAWALIVCPKSLLANWEDELVKWAPELFFARLTPKPSFREDAWRVLAGAVHVILTNYEQMRNPPLAIGQAPVELLIADEAHRMRNIDAQSARGMRSLKPSRFWALTGTPIERDSEDLANLLATIEPDRFSKKDARHHSSSLRSEARPYILRRLKADVLSELPDVIERHETLELLPAQKQAYTAQKKQHALTISDNQILALINALRTICDYDPKTGASIKVERISEILSEVKASGEKSVVFSYLIRPLEILQARLTRLFGRSASVLLVGSMPIDQREAALTSFRENADSSFLLASSRVAGEGLTLTEANHVIFLNEWWNPSANLQARDRVIRIGQSRGVEVYNFTCRDTVEEILVNILKTKRDLMWKVVDRLADAARPPGKDARYILEQINKELFAGGPSSL